MDIREGSINKITIFYTNIRSITKNLDQLLIYIHKQTLNYDIIALTETWVPKDKLHFFRLNGYQLFSQARNDGRRSGGAVIYVRETLQTEHITNIKMITGNIVILKVGIHPHTHITN